MSQFQPTLNPQSLQLGVADTNSLGNPPVLAAGSPGVTGVAFTTDGTDGLVTFTIANQVSSGPVAFAGAVGNTLPSQLPVGAQASVIESNIGQLTVRVTDAAGAALDISGISIRINLIFFPTSSIN